jgi:hypothetical protein
MATLVGSRGANLIVTSVMMPNVPSAPTITAKRNEDGLFTVWIGDKHAISLPMNNFVVSKPEELHGASGEVKASTPLDTHDLRARLLVLITSPEGSTTV